MLSEFLAFLLLSEGSPPDELLNKPGIRWFAHHCNSIFGGKGQYESDKFDDTQHFPDVVMRLYHFPYSDETYLIIIYLFDKTRFIGTYMTYVSKNGFACAPTI